MGQKQRWIGHYSSSHKILLVGEGDFSFSACLARAFRSATNMVATTLESQDTLLIEHWSSEAHVDELQRRGCLVLHEVDAYDMDQHPTLMFMKFDIVIFNFPHAGHDYWLCERDDELIRKHRGLLKVFFQSAGGMLGEGGEIHVSHRDGYPYHQWKLKELAEKAGLVLKEKVWFEKSDYPGYHQKRGGGIESNKTFPLKECYTFKFSLKRETSRELVSEVPADLMSGCWFRVSITNSVRKTIQDIREITGNHSEEEIYAILKECKMDPIKTAQKLLLQDAGGGRNSAPRVAPSFPIPRKTKNKQRSLVTSYRPIIVDGPTNVAHGWV